MDILQVLGTKLAQLPVGDHTKGLRAVQIHIEAALRHLKRAQDDADSTLFTDAIYRCNQAFEGSVKEAYRVLAGKAPEKLTPAKIEEFLSSGSVLRQRVLDQFSNYRKEWRNPSTHDYMLDFDENEALLAIVSVTVFAAALCGQINARLAAEEAKNTSPIESRPVAAAAPLAAEIANRLLTFASAYREDQNWSPSTAVAHLEGSLAGYLGAEFAATPEIEVHLAYRARGREADVAIRRGEELIAVEVKRMGRLLPSMVYSGLSYLSDLMERGFSGGVLFVAVAGESKYNLEVLRTPDGKDVSAILASPLSCQLKTMVES
jgi:HEPN domain-containing protein